ncbi:MAG: AMP-binding protein, partial [Stellaceae bacterium]
MDYAACRSLPAMFFAETSRLGDRPFLWAKHAGKYTALNWRETADRVNRLARGLVALGIEHGDRVTLVGDNCPEWAIADLAIMSAGAITVPAYVTNSVENHRHILGNSGARAVIVSTRVLAARVVPAAEQSPRVRAVIAIEDAEAGARVPVHSWDSVLASGAAQPDDIAERVAAIAPDDIACIIHTSGTGGLPKGVLASHRNILANCAGAYRLLEMLGLGDEVFLSFLPMSHSYEHTAGLMFPISIGAHIYFAEGADTLAHNLVEVRPTVMTAVPRLYEALHQRITRQIEREHGLKRRLFEAAVAIGRTRLAGEPLTLGQRLVD